MICYFDSSALVKRYIQESGHDEVCELLDNSSLITVSRLAYPEVLSALMRRQRNLNFSQEEFRVLVKNFRDDWQRFAVFDMNNDTLQSIDRVIESHRLRGADSIHLSTALWVYQNIAPQLLFVASDRELLEAARGERMTVLDPAEPTR